MVDFIQSHVFDRNDPKLADFHLKRLFLYPPFWKGFALPNDVTLSWKFVKFGDDCKDDIFTKKCGVYSFVVKPNIANHNSTSYLLYIGQTRRSLRERYLEYKADVKKLAETTRRPHVTVMLQKWGDYLDFAYAPLMDSPAPKEAYDQITSVENALIKGFLPPVNKSYKGEIQEIGTAINMVLGN